MTKTYRAVAPNGQSYTFKTKRPVAFAIFFRLPDGSYTGQFTKTADAARRTWGSKGVGLVRATQVQGA